MFDETHQSDWQDDIAIGDIVLFRFPISKPDGEAPKRRPCVVLEVLCLGGWTFVCLAYGTTSSGNANRGRELIVKQPEGLAAAGLNRPTRFIGARNIIVSVNHAGFRADGNDDARIGRLDAELMERLHEIRARLHAHADIAAENSRTRRAERQRWRQEGLAAAERNGNFLRQRALAGDVQ
jgi:hypothetical protein